MEGKSVRYISNSWRHFPIYNITSHLWISLFCGISSLWWAQNKIWIFVKVSQEMIIIYPHYLLLHHPQYLTSLSFLDYLIAVPDLYQSPKPVIIIISRTLHAKCRGCKYVTTRNLLNPPFQQRDFWINF